jgi:hypothetical protein
VADVRLVVGDEVEVLAARAPVGEDERILAVRCSPEVPLAVEADEDAVVEPGREPGWRQREPRSPLAPGAERAQVGVGQGLEGD